MFNLSAPLRVLTLTTLLATLPIALGATLDEWRSRSIYQVMTDRFSLSPHTLWTPCQTSLGPYCGGTWRGLLANLDYIQGMNFDAIWISPVVAQLPQYTEDGQSYAGYWQQDLFTLNPKFGTLDDLHALVQAIHDRGMLFMMDIMVNHMAYNAFASGPKGIDYTVLNPFDDPKYYHNYCELDYSGKNLTSLEVCWLGSWSVPLADLRTEDEYVQKVFGDWIEGMVANYSVDGLRIDAGVNVEPDFFPDFVKKAGVFATAEVYHANDSVVSRWEETVGSTLNYPMYWPLTSAFQDGGDFGDLVKMVESERSSFNDVTSLGTFSENQDVPRFGNHTSDMALAKNVATFVLTYDGIPIIYQGQEQHYTGGTDPYTNREPLWETGFNVFHPLYTHIATLNTLRHHVIQVDDKYTTTISSVTALDDNTLMMAKGTNGSQVITVLTNSGSNADASTADLSLEPLGYKSGAQLTEVLTCKTYTIASNGSLVLPMSDGEPAILYPADSLSESSLCGDKGQMFGDQVIQTVTMTTYTSTVGSSPTVMVSTATVPIVSSEITSSAAPYSATATSSGAAASSLSVGTSWSVWSTLLGLIAINGAIGGLLRSMA